MNSIKEARYGVWLHQALIGYLDQRGDYTIFRFTPEYLADPERAVLGLKFEERLEVPYSSALRLPPWFSNLLPEGRLREWIALDRGVNSEREMELLAQVGNDLPGAVQVVKADSVPDSIEDLNLHVGSDFGPDRTGEGVGWRFSLAGVALKFSMVRSGEKLTLPAHGEGGDWIVKLPDPTYDDVPVNENCMMTLAGLAGIVVPEHRLMHRDQLQKLPSNAWRGSEDYAYAVRRFDRGPNRELIHIEDFAQVRDFYPYNDGKYLGSFETVASLAYRRQDLESLRQVARRLAFNVLIANGDAHLKNWSLIYLDRRRPILSPAYDLVSTDVYRSDGDPSENLGLRFGKSRRFETVSLATFVELERKLEASGADLIGLVVDTTDRVLSAWPEVSEELPARLRDAIDRGIRVRRETLLRE